jgi:hypothetical protein
MATEITADGVSQIQNNTVTAADLQNNVVGFDQLSIVDSNSGSMVIPSGTTAQRSSANTGSIRFNTDTNNIELYDGSGWNSVVRPQITSITGNIYVGIETTLTVVGTNFANTINVVFTANGIEEGRVSDASVADGSATVSVPSGVYGLSSDTTVTISIENSDGTTSSNSIDKNVIQLPTGGTTTTSGSYRIHTFTSSSTFTMYDTRSLDVFMVGGGGGGGQSLAGGGGGGSAAVATALSKSAASYTITIGAGGAAGASENSAASSGGNTSAFGQTVTGGGGGNSRNDDASSSGGNGGGGGSDGNTGGRSGVKPSAITGFQTFGGFSGGNGGGGTPNYPGGGGAGCSQNGGTPSSASDKAGDGGQGITNDFLGTTYYFGGGGGGSSYTGSNGAGNGGAGGGGGGSANTGTAGTGGSGINSGADGASCGGSSECGRRGGNGGANTGGGAGAGAHQEATNDAANNQEGIGGSGIVIIRYEI